MKISKKAFFGGISVLFVLFLCFYYWSKIEGLFLLFFSAAAPLITGLVLAYVLNILMCFYERHFFNRFKDKKFIKKSKRPICMVMAILTLVAIVSAVVGLVIPELVSCIKLIVNTIPPFINKALKSDFVKNYVSKEAIAWAASFNWKEYLTKIAEFLLSGIGSAADAVMTAISSVVSVVATAFIGVVFCVYLLLDKDILKRQCGKVMKAYLKPAWVKKLGYWLEVLNESFHKFIVGQCTEAVVLGVLCIIGMLIFRFPYAVMIGTLVGFTALIPIVGAYIGAAVGAVVILTVSPLKALLFIVFLIVLQQLEGNLIYPRVVGKSIGLPAIWVLGAITVGGGLMGIYGMLLGVPLASAVYRLVSEDVSNRLSADTSKASQD